ncbi:cell division protein FtsL [Desulfuromonas sp.]|uniref:cell division protein FtsL n=1 Tax=Desulfuromonas sp. TaxID=892 RepID=UPI0025BBA849|nr:cell division protein FtsL [Desulfuromonas sp.]
MSDTIVRPIPKVNVLVLRRPRLFPLLGFVAILLAVSLFFVWSRLQVINLEYEISSLEGRLRGLQQDSRQLRLEEASLRSPARIEQVALNKLGLRMPNPSQVITVD